ncbi:MAG: secondary thiamine-phosphate synthase enzyme YjbQ [Spirochaetia bacterium]|jgi:secondary thiamine-phosphate synthase enzyme
MTWQKEISLQTSGHRDIKDLTSEVSRLVGGSGITTGIVNVSVVGSTASVGGIELEPGLAMDLPEILDRLVPPSRSYGHEQAWHDGNGHSHLQATLLGQSMSVPVSGGKPVLGTWQQIFLLECDVKPRRRTVVVTVTGD